MFSDKVKFWATLMATLSDGAAVAGLIQINGVVKVNKIRNQARRKYAHRSRLTRELIHQPHVKDDSRAERGRHYEIGARNPHDCSNTAVLESL